MHSPTLRFLPVFAASLCLLSAPAAQDPAVFDLRIVAGVGARSSAKETVRQEETRDTRVTLRKENEPQSEQVQIEQTSSTLNRTETTEEVLAVDERGVPMKVSRTFDRAEVSGEGSQTSNGQTQPLEKFSTTLPIEGAVVILEEVDGETDLTVRSGSVESPFLELLEIAPVSEFDRYYLPGKPVKLGEDWTLEEKRFQKLVRGNLEAGLAAGLRASMGSRPDAPEPELRVDDIEGEFRLKLTEVSEDGAVATLGLTGHYTFSVTGKLGEPGRTLELDVQGKAKVTGTMTVSLTHKAPLSLQTEEDQQTTITMEGTGPRGEMKLEIKMTNLLTRERGYTLEDPGAAKTGEAGGESGSGGEK